MPSREKDQSDFDLEAFIDLFDEALTSDDPSVQKTLQHLMVIAALARNHAKHDHRDGPMRRMFENQRDLIRRLERLESDRGRLHPGFGPVPNIPAIWPSPTTGTQWPPQPGTYPPGTIWAQGASSVTPPDSGAKSSTSYAWDPTEHLQASLQSTIKPGSAIAEKIDDLLKNANYKGSSVGANE
jgi:hypothetical protein